MMVIKNLGRHTRVSGKISGNSEPDLTAAKKFVNFQVRLFTPPPPLVDILILSPLEGCGADKLTMSAVLSIKSTSDLIISTNIFVS
jgi:hypothetical protein